MPKLAVLASNLLTLRITQISMDKLIIDSFIYDLENGKTCRFGQQNSFGPAFLHCLPRLLTGAAKPESVSTNSQ
jgi:hypothetical protein